MGRLRFQRRLADPSGLSASVAVPSLCTVVSTPWLLQEGESTTDPCLWSWFKRSTERVNIINILQRLENEEETVLLHGLHFTVNAQPWATRICSIRIGRRWVCLPGLRLDCRVNRTGLIDSCQFKKRAQWRHSCFMNCVSFVQANVFLFLPYVPTAVLLGDLFFFGQMDRGLHLGWDGGDGRTSGIPTFKLRA